LHKKRKIRGEMGGFRTRSFKGILFRALRTKAHRRRLRRVRAARFYVRRTPLSRSRRKIPHVVRSARSRNILYRIDHDKTRLPRFFVRAAGQDPASSIRTVLAERAQLAHLFAFGTKHARARRVAYPSFLNVNCIKTPFFVYNSAEEGFL